LAATVVGHQIERRECPVAEVQIHCRSDRSFRLDPERSALLVIDMQRYFFADANPVMAAVVPRVEQLVGWARDLACTVIHTREAYRADLSDVTSFKAQLGYVAKPGPGGRALVRGEENHDFLDSLAPRPGEPVIDKPGFSAFHGSDLHERLTAAGIDHLILCGVTTQCCVHSTLRSAVDLGYRCLTVADCCAAEERDLHDATLRIIAGEGHLFGWVCDLENLATAGRPG